MALPGLGSVFVVKTRGTEPTTGTDERSREREVDSTWTPLANPTRTRRS